MANNTNLKAAIANVIKQNGNQEITGDLLQQVLLNIVNAVGANSAFVGVATPATVPGSPDSNEFYIAVEPGLYANFGGYTITNKMVIFTNKSGSWVGAPLNYNVAHVDAIAQNVSTIAQAIVDLQSALADGLALKANTSAIKQVTGTSTTDLMSQKAVTDELALRVDKSAVKQVTGTSTTDLMSQKAVTDELLKKVDKESITPDFGTDTEKVISQKGYTDDMKAWLPSSVYSDRVTADNGSIRDKVLLKSMYDDALNLLPNTDLWYNFECGIKTRVSGLNTYVTKVYDLSANNRDAILATEASHPYLIGNINPANRYAIWGREKSFAFSQPIIKSGSDQWFMSIIANNLSTNSPFVYPTTGGAIFFNGSSIYFVNKYGANATLNHPMQNAISRYYLVAKNGILQLYINGKFISSFEINTAIDIDNLYVRDASIYDFRVFNKALSKCEIEFLDAKMAAFYPQFEGVEIGNQVWEASNAMDTIAPDGTLIPEVTDNTAWAALTTPAWCYYNNSEANGAVFGRIYNSYAVQKLTGSPIWRAPMSADYDQLSTFLGGNAMSGGRLKAEGLIYWVSPNVGATNESGFTAVAGGERLSNGDFRLLSATANFISLSNGVVDSKTISYSYSDLFTDRYDYKYGASLRRIRRVPPGENLREISSGMFSFPITSGAFKDMYIPNMYKISGVKITSSNALSNINLEIRTSSGVFLENIMSGKSHVGGGKTIMYSSILYDAEAMLQDYIVRATAVGNGGAGMEIELIIEKIKV